MILTRSHKLVHFLRMSEMAIYGFGAEITDAIEAGEKFVFDALPAEDAEIEATARLLDGRGLFRLPFENITVEADLTIEFREKEFGVHALALASQSESDDDITFHVAVNGIDLLREIAPGANGKAWIVSYFKYVLALDEPFFTDVLAQTELRKFYETADGYAFTLLEGVARHVAPVVAQRVLVPALVLLQTAGVRKERQDAPERLNRLRLKRRKQPIDAVTIIRVQEHLSAEARGSAGERQAPRLHMRRGHIRQQPYGPGLRKTREIFIQPCLVGHEAQGRILHDHYEMDEGALGKGQR